LFHKKGTPKYFPYLTRQVPKPWCTSNGTFHTEGKGSIAVKFFEYSNSKGLYIQPDIVEYDGDKLKKPVFDLIIGTKTMDELGIILNFKEQLITIDEIVLPMQNITQLPLPRKNGLDFNSLARSLEPKSTELATHRVVRILDANYKRADLPAVVKTCSHLSLVEQKKLLEVLLEYKDLFDGTLGDWKTEPVSFELKRDAKPYHSKAFPIPRVHKETILKEIKRLEELGVINANYKRADLPAVVKTCSHLSLVEQNMLLEVLLEYEDLFDGTLGDWKTEPASFELKRDVKPYHSRAFPIPRVHKETILKEIKRLEGVIEWQPTSEWAALSFI